MLPCGPNEGLPGKPINALFESRAGHLWVGSSDGLFEYIDGQCHSIPIDPLYITSITEDTSGKIFVGTGNGVRCFKDDQAQHIKDTIKKDGLPEILRASIYAKQMIKIVYSDCQGNIWIGTENELVSWSKGRIITEKLSVNPVPFILLQSVKTVIRIFGSEQQKVFTDYLTESGQLSELPMEC